MAQFKVSYTQNFISEIFVFFIISKRSLWTTIIHATYKYCSSICEGARESAPTKLEFISQNRPKVVKNTFLYLSKKIYLAGY